MRVVRVFLPLLIAAVIVMGFTAILVTRPDLQKAEDKVDATWRALETKLTARYELLSAADERLRTIPGPVQQIATDVDAAFARWQTFRGNASVDAQVKAANTLEALGRRLVVTAARSPRVAADQVTKNAIALYVDDDGLAGGETFNAAVAAYQEERRGPIRGIVASLLGQEDVPALDTTSAPA
jgi:hypothetical protein